MSVSLVSDVANRLLNATASDALEVSKKVLAHLVRQLDVDSAFVRHNDPDHGASVLVAEWPPRCVSDGYDPLAVVPFSRADPVFAVCDDGRKPVVVQPDHRSLAFRIAGNRHVGPPTVACAPLITGQLTTGMLGFVKFGRGNWKPEEINTLEAVASLFAYLQARIAAEERAHYLADHDDLTGLHNRRALLAHLSRRLAKSGNESVAILYHDLDRLKSVNDCFGHTAGDWLIQVFAERLREHVGNESFIARIGGDEFVVVPDRAMTIDAAGVFAHRLQPTLCARLTIFGESVCSTVSIGVASSFPGLDDCADLLSRADEAVLTAKRAGGNQVALSNAHMSLKNLLRNDIGLRLHADLEKETFALNYLPEVDLWSGAIVAVEALVRWQHPEFGLLLPDSFIGIVESMNLAGELGHWVMRKACAEFSRWRSNGLGQSAALRINVSPAQLVARGFVRSVADAIDEFGIDSGSVCLEITERAMVRDIETTRKTLHELKDVGVQIAIDDFGTGFAVLSHLKSLPLDVLKIDTAFVRDLGTSGRDLAIVRAIIGLAEAFELEVVAEGVETPEAAMTLLRHGCRRAQGYLLSRPLPARAMESLLSTGWMPMPFLADSQALTERPALVVR